MSSSLLHWVLQPRLGLHDSERLGTSVMISRYSPFCTIVAYLAVLNAIRSPSGQPRIHTPCFDPFRFFCQVQAPLPPISPYAIRIMSADILPTRLPLDASTHFSDVLKPYLRALISRYSGRGVRAEREYEDALSRATVASEGKLADKHASTSEVC